MRRFLLMLLVCAVSMGLSPAPATAAVTAIFPVPGPVVRGFDPPAERWGAGHRGIDLGADAGDVVVAPAAGRVTFAGDVAGRPVVVISHSDVRSTLEPVRATVSVGTVVTAGQEIGVVVAGHACPAATCLHWGVRDGDTYIDPLSLTASSEVRLLPDDAAATVIEHARARVVAASSPARGSGVLARPVPGAITSPFGQRFHPIFHEWRLHAGVDFSASCGTPIRAAADGTVTHAAWDASGGWRLIVDHGTQAGVHLQTVYLHAQGYAVSVGQRVSRGEVVGTVGTTGWSTGCHLHFSVKADGRQVDPEGWM